MKCKFKIDPDLEKCLPPLPLDQWDDLKKSVAKGYDPAKPIVLWKERPSTIVDGHHRYKACLELGIEPAWVEESFDSIDAAILYTLRRQMTQRELTAGQKINIANQMISIEEMLRLKEAARANESPGVNQYTKRSPADRQETTHSVSEVAVKIAERAGVHPRSVYRFNAIKEKGIPEVSEAVLAGKIGIDAANNFVQHIPKEKQIDIVKTGGVGAIIDTAREIRDLSDAKAAAKKADTEEEARRFSKFESNVKKDMALGSARIEKMFKGAEEACFLPNVQEMWCSDCNWGFDVYLPPPVGTFSCPYCTGQNLTKREIGWHPPEV